MSLLVIGTVAFDDIETPFAKRKNQLGGSATYFSAAASLFGPVRLVGVVGDDFPQTRLAPLRRRGVDTAGLEVAEGKTFRWAGRYEADWNTRHTLDTQLNVLADFDPKVPSAYRDSSFLFLANTAPNLQAKVLKQIAPPRLAMLDTMNLWIDVARKDLLAVLKRIDGIVLNDEEARMLTGERSLLRAARKVLDLGPRFAVLKKGEHGAFLIGKNVHYALPAYPVDDVVDPTGAGDSFAGGFLGYLASVENVEPPTLRRAMVYGTVTASFCVEGFGIDKLAKCDRSALESRVNEFLSIVT